MGRIPRVLATLLLATSLVASTARAETFVSWTSVDLNANNATGTMGSVGVTFSGTDLNFFQSNSTAFNGSAFCPQLGSTDLVEFTATTGPGSNYTIQFSRAVHNPILHLRSVGSRLTFTGSSITPLCGQAGFTVSGNQVIAADCFGGGPPPIDSDNNGTIRVDGWVTSVTFNAVFDQTKPGCSGAGSIDGIDIQIGADAVGVPAASPSSRIVLALLTLALGAWSLRRSWNRPPQA